MLVSDINLRPYTVEPMGVNLLEVEVWIDLVPLDFESLADGEKIFDVISEITFALGVSIKPHIINILLDVVMKIFKVTIKNKCCHEWGVSSSTHHPHASFGLVKTILTHHVVVIIP